MEEEKAKCSNCGDSTDSNVSKNFDYYCVKEACKRAFMQSVLKKRSK